MENENKNNIPQGWKDVQINPDMPLNMLVNFMNILNQRLCSIEDILMVTDEDGQELSLTEYYAKHSATPETTNE